MTTVAMYHIIKLLVYFKMKLYCQNYISQQHIYSHEQILKVKNNKHKFFLIKINDHIKSNNAGITNWMHLHQSFKFVQKRNATKWQKKENLFALTCAI